VAQVTAHDRALLVVDAPATAQPGDEPLTIDAPFADPKGHRVVIGRLGPMHPDGRRPVEVVVDGWRFEFEVEDAGRASIRERASRDRSTRPGGGEPLEIRAIIPGRIASVAVTVGDTVEAGQSLLAVEAMKMQNELRSPRDGVVGRLAVGERQTIEVGDLLAVIE
jgi:biotin carboxyl carrier protein